MKKRFFARNLILFIIPMLIPLLILGALSIIISQRYIKEDINKNNVNLLKQTRENVELILNELDPLSLIFDSDPFIQDTLSSLIRAESLSFEELTLQNVIRGFLNASPYARPYIHSVYVSFDSGKGRFLSSSEGIVGLSDYFDKSWYESYAKQKDVVNTWVDVRQIRQYSFESHSQRIVSIYKRIFSVPGVIVLNIYPGYIEDIMNNLVTLPEQSFIVLNEDGQVIFGNKNAANIDLTGINKHTEPLFTQDIQGESFMITQLRSERYGWKYISITPQSQLYKVPIMLSQLTMILLLLSLALGVVLAFYLTRLNYNHIASIISIIESAESGKPLPPLPDRIHNEYSYIIQNILKTFIEQSYLKLALSERKYKMKTMELTALQSQINPHFLFNTLKTIYWMSFGLTNGQNAVSEMIENLSDILNYVLGSPQKTVPLENEIKTTQSYIAIQKVRYKDKFDVIWEYDKEAVKCDVIKLLLQPLIENSIYHGIKEKEGNSLIKIKIIKTDSFIKIAVIDNGLGMDRNALEKLRQKLSDDSDYSEHIGLFNTNKRLILTYGEDCTIRIQSKYGLGTAVYMAIPAG